MTRAASLVLVLVTLALAGLASAAGAPPGDRPVPVAGCEGLYYERAGKPDVVIVSDLPLEDSAHTAMHQMTQAIKLTLKDRGFRAGRFHVGYVVCDDSGPAGTWTVRRCRANARAAARVANVVGVIGTLDSGCARVIRPVLADAGIVLVSPLNTAVDLTRPHRSAVARLSAPDDAQAAAAARFVRGSGAKTVAALSDGSARGDVYRTAFARAARALGLRVVTRGHADAAYVGGLLGRATRAELAAARRLAPSGPLVLAAGFGPAAQLATVAGALAEDAYLVVAGVPVEQLGEAGRRFVTHFETNLGHSPHPYAVYAAQAARVLLNGIAASNGTRRSVAAQVLATKVGGGLIGSFAFDENGDPTSAAVTIFRIHAGAAEIVRVVDSGVP